MKKKTKKKLQKQLRQQRHVWLAITAGVLLCASAMLYAVLSPTPVLSEKRLVTFYDRGVKHVVLTRAQTVGAALSDSGITVDSHDEVEPSLDSKLSSSYVDVIIYRSRLVAIVDGRNHQTVLTVAQSPNAILKAARLKPLGRKDKTTIKAGNVLTGGAAVVLEVDRVKLKSQRVIFIPRADALTISKGAQVFVDKAGVAHRETYYDLPMNVVIGTCGRGGGYSIRSDGAKVDRDGYVLVAANLGSYPRCTIVETSLGLGKVYDTGGFAARYPYGYDLATDWTNHDGR